MSFVGDGYIGLIMAQNKQPNNEFASFTWPANKNLHQLVFLLLWLLLLLFAQNSKLNGYIKTMWLRDVEGDEEEKGKTCRLRGENMLRLRVKMVSSPFYGDSFVAFVPFHGGSLFSCQITSTTFLLISLFFLCTYAIGNYVMDTFYFVLDFYWSSAQWECRMFFKYERNPFN